MNKGKQLTKKMIAINTYAEFGIECNGDHILDPYGEWIPELIPFASNGKVGNAGTWSIAHGNETHDISEFLEKFPKTAAVMKAAGVTSFCGSCPCHCKDCYCDSGRFPMDSMKHSLVRKLLLATYHRTWLENAIKACIKLHDIDQVRIHAAGDFFCDEYVDMWKRIIEYFPLVTFWTYTKQDHAVNAFDGLQNITVTPSITPHGVNFGTCAELLETYTALVNAGFRVHVCACGTPFEIHCSDCKHGCKAIGKECDYVLFIKHSAKDYKAGKKDPAEYAAVLEIIKNQNNQ